MARRRQTAPARDLVARIGEEVRRMGAQSVMTSQAVAARFALNMTDLEALDLIFLRGRATAGELAQATGLSSGAATALIDRLEKAGYVSRTHDADDRRRVYVSARREAVAPIEAVYKPLQARMLVLWSTYSARDLAVVLDFLKRSTDAAVESMRDIQGEAVPSPAGRPARAKRTTKTVTD
jgi:DNA-binding MarR family transcriptional regulator